MSHESNGVIKMHGIVRIAKFKRSAVFGLQLERQRTKDDGRNFAYSDIDKDRTDQNLHIKQTKSWNREITKQLKQANVKERKDSNVVLGAVFTASKEFFEKHPDDVLQYFKECYWFYIKNYCGGNPDKILDCTIDFDEETPHMQIYSIPTIEKDGVTRLSAKELVGNRNDLRKMQDLFHSEICKKRGFERGELVRWDLPYEERKKHQKTKDFKKAREKAEHEQLVQAKETIKTECNQMVANAEKLLSGVEDNLLKEDAWQFVQKGSYNDEYGKKQYLQDVFEQKYLPSVGYTQNANYQDFQNAFNNAQNALNDILDIEDEEIDLKQ